MLNTASLKVAVVDLGTADVGRVLSPVSMPDNLRIFLAHFTAVVCIYDLNLFPGDANRSAFLAGQILHPFLEAHAGFGHVGLFHDSVIRLVDHLLAVSSRRRLLRVVISLHSAVEGGSCLNVRLVHWVDSVVAAQVGSLIGGLSSVAHAHVHLLFDAVRNAVVTFWDIV